MSIHGVIYAIYLKHYFCNNMRKILYVGYRDNNHSIVGGYDHIIDNPFSDSLMGEELLFGNIPVNKRGKFLNILVLDLHTRLIRFKYEVTHIFYGDTLLFPYSKRANHKIVATIHMSLEMPRKNQNLFFRALKSLDGIVVLSSNQKKILLERYGINSVFIPHGFNSPRFIKQKTTIDKKFINIVVLGQNYRDYDCLIESLNYCQEHCPNIRFHFIGQPKWFKEKASQYQNAIVYSRLKDDEYFSVIDDCDYNFLPVTFATANNALLEAQFLGIVSILPVIEGIEDYSAPSPLNKFYNNREELYNLFSSIEKTDKSPLIIDFCKRFKWDNVYSQLNEFYNSLF